MIDEDRKRLYKFSDDLLFDVVAHDVGPYNYGDVMFFCPKHRVAFVNSVKRFTYGNSILSLACPICEQQDKNYVPLTYANTDLSFLQRKAFSIYDSQEYKNAKLVRLDDFYTPEIKGFDAINNKNSNYSIKADVKTDKDGDTIVILYISYKGEKEKSQFFIKPEKKQLSNDHKDMDPSKILAKIKLTLKDRVITQDFGKK